MRPIITVLAFLAAAAAQAQCNIIRNEVDPFTKLRTVIVKSRPFATLDFAVVMEFRAVGDSYFIDMRAGVDRSFEGVPADARMLFLLADDSVVETFCTYPAIPEAVINGPNISWAFRATYSISPDQLALLASSPVKVVRFYHYNTYEDHPLKSNRQMQITNAAKCLVDFK